MIAHPVAGTFRQMNRTCPQEQSQDRCHAKPMQMKSVLLTPRSRQFGTATKEFRFNIVPLKLTGEKLLVLWVDGVQNDRNHTRVHTSEDLCHFKKLVGIGRNENPFSPNSPEWKYPLSGWGFDPWCKHGKSQGSVCFPPSCWHSAHLLEGFVANCINLSRRSVSMQIPGICIGFIRILFRAKLCSQDKVSMHAARCTLYTFVRIVGFNKTYAQAHVAYGSTGAFRLTART